jgi:hypothetical protein
MHNQCTRCGKFLKNKHSLIEHLKKPKVCPPKVSDIDRQSILDKLPVKKIKPTVAKLVVNKEQEPILEINKVEEIKPNITVNNNTQVIENLETTDKETIVNIEEPVATNKDTSETTNQTNNDAVDDDPLSRIKADLLLTGTISQKDFFQFLDKLDAKVHERLTEIEDMYRERFERLNLANAAILTKFTERYNNEMLDIKELYQSFMVLVKK